MDFFKVIALLVAATYLCTAYHNYYQTKYEMLAERGYLTYVNPDYLYNTYLRVYRYNKTVKAYDFGYGVKYVANTTVWIDVVTSRWMSNEYRRFPMDLKMDVCRGLEEGSFGFRKEFLRNGNVSCPFIPGYYLSVANLVQSQKFPPGIPAGRYRLIAQITHNGTILLGGQVFCEIRYKRI